VLDPSNSPAGIGSVGTDCPAAWERCVNLLSPPRAASCAHRATSSTTAAAFLLSFNTLLALEKNGTLTSRELGEVVEQFLTRLKTLDAWPSLQSQAAREFARELLERLHARLNAGNTSMI
jgi:hypothetical protein